jgi:hypothetical protein
MWNINIKSVILGIGIGMLLSSLIFMAWASDKTTAQETISGEEITENCS